MNSRNMREDMFLLDKNGKCDEIVINVGRLWNVDDIYKVLLR